MILADLISGAVKPYLEYAWVCAPNAAGQSITANTVTTLTIDTEIADTGGFGSIDSNQITLAAGTYAFEVWVRGDNSDQPYSVLGLYNVTASEYVTRGGALISNAGLRFDVFRLTGQMTLSVSTTLDLRILSGGTFVVKNAASTHVFTTSTAGLDQRATIKLWKLA